MKTRYRIALDIATGFFILMVIMGTGIEYLRAPSIRGLSRVLSPDNRWVALIEDEEYKSIFTPPFYLIILQPQTGWLQPLMGQDVFEVSQMSATLPPDVVWHGNRECI